ncbi:hypothetical protein BACUNI_04122 [Bacteroides uniformis ATCC 8492]|uniref:Uncharacterized protein n=1 Tax=Bacteroides uniformis (strain ATCC 8492 / DSM 6597 / CCUG 4942 / CIP 103695 / JCM 5828 / KCTC 5204 / NCTC 13054 / VPI 0061) TaxID=411479 RepID=A0ABC9N6Z0_BACUC|nr:hypothetical protein BACUNI_04122 [Bacteroides uniformis ATCC 8492]
MTERGCGNHNLFLFMIHGASCCISDKILYLCRQTHLSRYQDEESI